MRDKGQKDKKRGIQDIAIEEQMMNIFNDNKVINNSNDE